MWTIFQRSSLNVTILLLLYFFGCKACRILAPQPGIEPMPPALEGQILTKIKIKTPRKSLMCWIYDTSYPYGCETASWSSAILQSNWNRTPTPQPQLTGPCTLGSSSLDLLQPCPSLWGKEPQKPKAHTPLEASHIPLGHTLGTTDPRIPCPKSAS